MMSKRPIQAGGLVHRFLWHGVLGGCTSCQLNVSEATVRREMSAKTVVSSTATGPRPHTTMLS